MKISEKIDQLTILFLLLNFSMPAAETRYELVETVELSYQGEEMPLYCFVPHKKLARPRIGLALSGGGLRGVAQVGVLKALEEQGIPIDGIVGTSIGALVGGLYASGYDADELWEITRRIDWASVLDDTPQRSTLFLGEKEKGSRAFIQFRLDGLHPVLPEALTPGFKLTEILTRLVLNAPFHAEDFSRLPIPLKIITSDLLTGRKVILQHGDLAEAIRASIAIPLLLTPVELDSMMLIDGGVLDNMPVQESRDMGADIVIAVNTTSPLRRKEDMKMPWEIADQVTTIMQREREQAQLEKADIVIDLADLPGTSTDAEKIELFYAEGHQRMAAQIDRLKRMLRPRTPDSRRTYHFKRITVEGAEELACELPMERTPDRPVRKSEIVETLARIYGLGCFESVRAEILADGADTLLCYRLRPYPLCEKVIFEGNENLPDSLLMRVVRPMLGQPINVHRARRSLKELLRLYRQRGYSLAEISDTRFDPAQKAVYISIREGKVGSITFSGNRRTKDFVIKREFPFNSGHVFRSDLVSQGINNIYGTGLFKTITLKLKKRGPAWDLNLQFQEKVPHVVRIGAHYDRERNGRSFIEFANENLLGTGNDLTLHAQYGDRDLVASIDYRADRIFKTLLTTQINLHYVAGKHYAYENFVGVGEYERSSTGAIFTLGRQIERFGTLAGFMRIEEIDIRGISGHGYDPGRLDLKTFGLKSIVDTRDRVPFPRSGKYHRFFYEVSAGKFLDADISFFKVMNQLASFWSPSSGITLCPKFIWGTSDLTTPFSEQFRLGGRDSFYGLRQGEMQGRHMILGSLEVRMLLPRRLLFDTYLSFRFDVGAVWENVVDVHAQDFINGRGVALAFKTPLGPITFAYGRASHDKRRVYFTAGYSF